MRRVLVASLIVVLMTASSTFAADQDGAAAGGALGLAALSVAPLAEAAADSVVAPRSFAPRRPAILPALYGASGFLQGYDAYSTLAVLKHGGIEANPIMQGATRNPAAFIGLKAGVTVMSIMAAERMWKGHNRVAAVATMALTNSLMAMVAANNARVLSRIR